MYISFSKLFLQEIPVFNYLFIKQYSEIGANKGLDSRLNAIILIGKFLSCLTCYIVFRDNIG
jgi:hypothetical protein